MNTAQVLQFSTYWDSFAVLFRKFLEETRFSNEAAIQVALATNRPRAKGNQDDEQRAMLRLLRISAAIRPFLEYNHVLTECSGIPLIHALEVRLLRTFVRNFQRVEHGLSRRMSVCWTEWRRPGSYRDRLSALLCVDSSLYRRVLLSDTAAPSAVNELLTELSRALTATEATVGLAA